MTESRTRVESASPSSPFPHLHIYERMFTPATSAEKLLQLTSLEGALSLGCNHDQPSFPGLLQMTSSELLMRKNSSGSCHLENFVTYKQRNILTWGREKPGPAGKTLTRPQEEPGNKVDSEPEARRVRSYDIYQIPVDDDDDDKLLWLQGPHTSPLKAVGFAMDKSDPNFLFFPLSAGDERAPSLWPQKILFVVPVLRCEGSLFKSGLSIRAAQKALLQCGQGRRQRFKRGKEGKSSKEKQTEVKKGVQRK
ncbi:hypothetical protein EXN66_Car021280 [Channa argus]|uniref:Uncharacterized protein n=1 Tax=Channa argus TaxID=215402 RepID=A0A6G1QTE7_CHAAH|nr:hypothetical protein EXN66_Car021280 [Channa argus]